MALVRCSVLVYYSSLFDIFYKIRITSAIVASVDIRARLDGPAYVVDCKGMK